MLVVILVGGGVGFRSERSISTVLWRWDRYLLGIMSTLSPTTTRVSKTCPYPARNASHHDRKSPPRLDCVDGIRRRMRHAPATNLRTRRTHPLTNRIHSHTQQLRKGGVRYYLGASSGVVGNGLHPWEGDVHRAHLHQLLTAPGSGLRRRRAWRDTAERRGALTHLFTVTYTYSRPLLSCALRTTLCTEHLASRQG